MNAEQSISGTRPRGDRPKERQLAMDYLHLSKQAADLLRVLRKTPGKNCEGRDEEFSGEELMTNQQARLACASCPALDLCREYAEVARPAWGTHGGVVFGRNLQIRLAEGDEDVLDSVPKGETHG